MRRRVRPLIPILVTTILVVTAVGCSDDAGGSKASPTERLSGIYAAAIEAIATDALVTLPTEDDDLLTVFVTAHEDVVISADVQVGVVSALESWASVRFIDSLDEAIDRDAEWETVRGDGILVGLGEVSGTDVTARLSADRYVSTRLSIVYDLDLARRSGVWRVELPLDAVEIDGP